MKNRVIICGGGESISQGIELNLWEQIKNEEVWSINYMFLTTSFLPSREIWVDIVFFRRNVEKLEKLYKSGVACYAKAHQAYNTIPEINQYVTTRNIHEANKKLFIGFMGLGGAFALHLACKEEYKNIFLLGFDFTFNKETGKTHYYQDTLKDIYSTGVGNTSLYEYPDGKVREQIKDFEFFLQFTNSKIWNVSPKSKIPYFEKLNYVDFFNKLKE